MTAILNKDNEIDTPSAETTHTTVASRTLSTGTTTAVGRAHQRDKGAVDMAPPLAQTTATPKTLTASASDPDIIPGGLLWSSEAASSAVSREDEDTGEQRRICFRNSTSEKLILCWIGTSSPTDLHHFYTLAPSIPSSSSRRGLRGTAASRRWRKQRSRDSTTDEVAIAITDQDHVETSVEGHAFVIIAADDISAIQKGKSLVRKQSHGGGEVRLIGAYRAEPEIEQSDSENESHDDEEDETRLHLVEIIDDSVNHHRQARKGPWQALRKNAASWRQRQRKSEPVASEEEQQQQAKDETVVTPSTPNRRDGYRLSARWVVVKNVDPLDTRTTQQYQADVWGHCRWPVQIDTSSKWSAKDRRQQQAALEADLDAMAHCLPPHAVTLLRDTYPTPVWVNRTLQYGPKCFPITATGMCFHPAGDWLERHCMHKEKCESVELYDINSYVNDDRALWGIGGLLLHEFSHAYHHKACTDGYDNAEIIACYQAAMDEGLYDSVRVKGTQGPEARAYACTNAMEYFAELSTAFLGGVPRRCSDTTTKDTNQDETAEDFNKWYPFNRQQLREHDPRAYEMLKKVWQVADDQ